MVAPRSGGRARALWPKHTSRLTASPALPQPVGGREADTVVGRDVAHGARAPALLEAVDAVEWVRLGQILQRQGPGRVAGGVQLELGARLGDAPEVVAAGAALARPLDGVPLDEMARPVREAGGIRACGEV